MTTATVWTQLAREVCEEITALQLPAENEDAADLSMIMLLGLACAPGCPEAYKKLAQQIIPDGRWGAVATRVLKFAASCTESQVTMDEVAAYCASGKA